MDSNTKLQGSERPQFNYRNENMIILHCVRHALELKRSLVSIDMLVESGYRMTVSESSWLITKWNIRINHGSKYNNLYLLNMLSLEGIINVTELPNVTLWHGRVGLEGLTGIDYIPKLQEKTNFCDHCRYRKQTWSPHSLHYKMVC